jgi:DNA-binding MarR family transcriptional regulator
METIMENQMLQAGIRIINRYNSFANKARNYGTDVTLYPSEIHLIDAIGLDGNMTTTKLASTLGITKGGISQTVCKLMNKGLVTKSEGDGINEVYISLSDKGRTAYLGHKKLHEALLIKMNELTDQMSDETQKAICDMIRMIDDELSRLELE